MEKGQKSKILDVHQYKKTCRDPKCIFNGGSRQDGFGGCRLNIPKIIFKNKRYICVSNRHNESQRKQV